jgi:hypothetical protein
MIPLSSRTSQSPPLSYLKRRIYKRGRRGWPQRFPLRVYTFPPLCLLTFPSKVAPSSLPSPRSSPYYHFNDFIGFNHIYALTQVNFPLTLKYEPAINRVNLRLTFEDQSSTLNLKGGNGIFGIFRNG